MTITIINLFALLTLLSVPLPPDDPLVPRDPTSQASTQATTEPAPATQQAEATTKPAPSPIVTREFIFEKAPFKSCHASTIVETKTGLIAAWFGGSTEGAKDVGIWMSRMENGAWSDPFEVADGKQSDNTRWPCWNPVLCRPKEGTLILFYKVGPNPARWWGMMMTSNDDGKTWGVAKKLPDGIYGPAKNKPIMLDGAMLCGSSTERSGWDVQIEQTNDLGVTWAKPVVIEDRGADVIQPTILNHGEGKLQILCRSRHGKIYESRSTDNGKSWSEMAATDLPNPNSGIDAVKLKDGRSLLVYNHAEKGRSELIASISQDDGRKWTPLCPIEEYPLDEFSYPSVIQTADGLVHITYTWKRQKISHVVIDLAKE